MLCAQSKKNFITLPYFCRKKTAKMLMAVLAEEKLMPYVGPHFKKFPNYGCSHRGSVVNEPTYAGLIPGLTRWVKDMALL